MQLFNKSNNLKSNSNIVGTGNDISGVNILNLGQTSLTNGIQNINLQSIDAINGNPIVKLHFQFSITDTSGATAPTSCNPVETAINNLSFSSQNGGIQAPLINFEGAYGHIERWSRIKNPQGNYVNAPNPQNSVVSTSTTSIWNFTLTYKIHPSLFPIKPKLVLAPLSARTNGSTELASSIINYFNITADYKKVNSFQQTRLSNVHLPIASTGLVSIQSYLNNGINILQHAFDVGVDANLNNSQSFNLKQGANVLIDNLSSQSIIDDESEYYSPSYNHIDGFYPLKFAYPYSLFKGNTFFEQLNISAVPQVDITSTNNTECYVEELL